MTALMAFVELAGARLWFEDSRGTGVPVVFVHPAATTSECWVYQVEAFTKAGYRCITYDLRGWGKSQMDTDADDVGTMSDDLEALVRALKLDSIILVAAAYGGFGGVEYALRFPRRLRALVLATSQGGLVDPEYVSVLDRVVSPHIRALPVHLRELGPSYRAEDPQGVERWLQIAREAGQGNPKRQPRALEITLPLLETLRVPTLLVAGAADLLAPPALMRLMAERIPSCVFATVAEAGHSAHWERAAEWNRIVLAFLQQH